MLTAVAFQTRARTIDHLGREQIADCPTAITELWKNAFDAYARSVNLHILDGDICTVALVDDGHGMSREEFEQKWLVVGTESKASGTDVPEADRNGLPLRKRQGQKGIGRLSAAALGPLMLLISKRADQAFVASLIDWRLFENPFLLLNDIKIPVVEFLARDELPGLLSQMFDSLMGNVWGDTADGERDMRLAKAWKLFDELESREQRPSTREAIERVLIETSFTERQLQHWPAWNGQRVHGTAMLVADIAFDLQAQLATKIPPSDEQAATQARDRLVNTLVNFTDPYAGKLKDFGDDVTAESQETDEGEESRARQAEFSYSVMAWEGVLSRLIVSDVRTFSNHDLGRLEHVVDGTVDELGIFRGKVKAFGKWIDDEVTITPPFAVPTRSDSKVGPFDVRLGTFEFVASSSTHEATVHAKLLEQAGKYAGFMVYRDNLRVMPYGREDNDFFEIERRRGMNAGREFWSIRRLFGRVALSRETNPNLKDKAGREGIIDNKAAKVFRDIVENVLMTTARRFFGSDSTVREETLPQIKADRKRQKAEEAQKKLRSRKRKEFRKNLDTFLPEMRAVRAELEELAELARNDVLPSEESGLLTIRNRLQGLKERQTELSLGQPPANLGTLEGNFKEYRANAARSADLIVQLRDSISLAIDKIKPKSQHDIAYAELSRNAAFIHARLRKWSAEARQLLSAELNRVGELVDERNKAYHSATLPMLNALEAGELGLSEALGKLEAEKERQDVENAETFESYVSTLRSLKESIDLENLVNFAMAESQTNRDEIQRLNSLAQLGITVEIIGHEIESFDGAIADGLRQLPDAVKHTAAYNSIKTGHESLSDRLRFLSPLKLSGDRSSRWITGSQIAEFVRTLLGSSLADNRINFIVTPEFERFSVFDQLARLLPVFVNLVNNSIYWVSRSSEIEKEIELSVIDQRVIISDNGPGVDPEDERNLFSLFFTRKVRGGRGVGLYLSRANLAAGGHTISYITDQKSKRLAGANFAIEFNGAKYE
ncbi:MAG: ATP-binding protein [Candidatus Pacebacteria bacterium]|nr:ATP-binding protein [Candidatus Paceibacterota bacterium]